MPYFETYTGRIPNLDLFSIPKSCKYNFNKGNMHEHFMGLLLYLLSCKKQLFLVGGVPVVLEGKIICSKKV